MRTTLAILTAITLAGCSNDPTATDETEADISSDLRPDGKGALTAEAHSQKLAMQAVLPAARPVKGNGISYHGGPVMTGTVEHLLHLVRQLGRQQRDDHPARLHRRTSAARRTSTSTPPTTTASGTHVSGAITYAGATDDAYSHGTVAHRRADPGESSPTRSAATQLPNDTNGIYFVLTSTDVNATSGFCTPVLRLAHDGRRSKGKDVKYSFVGNPDRCPTSCADADRPAPTATPAPTAWPHHRARDARRRSATPTSTPGTTGAATRTPTSAPGPSAPSTTASNGSKYNITLGTRNYLIQQNWVNASRRLLRDVVLTAD